MSKKIGHYTLNGEDFEALLEDLELSEKTPKDVKPPTTVLLEVIVLCIFAVVLMIGTLALINWLQGPCRDFKYNHLYKYIECEK